MAKLARGAGSLQDYNQAPPHIMHIDLNSCFATVEQQARPRLRGRPVAVLNRRTPDTSIVAASYEAKARGVKVGMKFYEAQRLCPEIVGIDSDPPKYRHVYHELLRIMSSYSPAVAMKSIDEGVIDFVQATEETRARGLEAVNQDRKSVV